MSELKDKLILVVDDESRMVNFMRMNLELEGCRVITATNGREALDKAREEMPDVALLDIMMPGMDGFETLRRLRTFSQMPVLILTAKDDEDDRIKGLELGADDYIGKPFSPKELLARVRAVLRRARPTEEEHALSSGGVTLDAARHRVTVGGAPVELTPKEFDLLHALMAAAGRVLSREFLLNRVWGYARADEIESRTIDVHVRRLRAKLGDAGRHIATVKSVGYRFDSE